MTQPPPAPTPPPAGSGAQARGGQLRDLSTLRRASDHRMLAGVAEGISRHFDIDPILVRVIFGALAVFGGSGFFLYAAAWLTIPADNENDSILSSRLRQPPGRVMVAGLSIAAVVTVATMLGAIGFSAPHPGPVIAISIVALVALVIFSRRRDDNPPGRFTSPTAGPNPGDTAATPTQPAPTLPAAAAPTQSGALASSVAAPTAPTAAWWEREPSTGGPVAPPPVATPPTPPGPRRPRSHLFSLTIAVIAIALGLIWIVDQAAGLHVPWSVYPGTALGIVALALLLGTWYGRARGLILVGVVASLLTAATSVVDHGPFGMRIYTPTTSAAVANTYTHGVGLVSLHLEDVADVSRLAGRQISVDSTIGQVRVSIPTSVDATVYADVDHGVVHGPAQVQNLANGEQRATMTPVDDADPNVTLHIHLGYGEIRIERVACPPNAFASGPQAGQSTITWTGETNDPPACN